MADTATAKGTAHGPTVSVADLTEQLREALDREEALAPQYRVENAQRKVAKIEAMLAGAKDELKAATAALKGN